MTEEILLPRRVSFWLAWVVANAIGLGLGWPLGELVGLQVADYFGWATGELVGFLICEGFIWLARLAALSRVREQRILSAIEVFAWLLAESFGWFAGRIDYDPEGLVGVTSGSILAYHLGVIVWLIIWLVRVQQPSRRTGLPLSRRVLGSAMRIIGSLTILALMLFGAVFGIEIGYAAAEMFGLIMGRAVAGIALGAGAGALTGWAMLSLIGAEAWKVDAAA